MWKLFVAFAALGIALANPAMRAEAGEWRWARGSHMGGPFAGVVAAEGAQLTFGCWGEAAPSWQRGPHLLGLLPAPQRADLSAVLEIHIDSSATQLPVELIQDDGVIAFVWKPNQKFDLGTMKSLIANLRGAKQIEMRIGDITASLPVMGAAEALADDPLQCP